MFEHFGLKDIWPTIKKNRFLIVILVSLFTLVFGLMGVKKVKTFLDTTHDENCPLYAASASYYVQPDVNDDSIISIDSDFWKSLPDNYVSLMNTDVCANFIYEKIASSYTTDYLIKNSEFSNQTASANSGVVNIESVKKLYKVSREKGTMVINVYALAYNEELSKSILKECRNFIEVYADNQIKNSHIEFTGETVKIIKSSSELSKDEDNKTTSTSSESGTKAIILIIVKNSVVPIVGLSALLILIILFISAFSPTLNRKSDFCEYDVPIIGEIKS